MSSVKLLKLGTNPEKECVFLSTTPSENGFENPYFKITPEEYMHRVIPERYKASKGIGLKPNYVPDTYFFLYNENDTIVGLFKIRHYLNDTLKNGAGHIGYIIKREYRNHGYATIGIHLALKKLKHLALLRETEAYFQISRDNIYSYKALIKNKAYIVKMTEDYIYLRIKLR